MGERWWLMLMIVYIFWSECFKISMIKKSFQIHLLEVGREQEKGLRSVYTSDLEIANIPYFIECLYCNVSRSIIDDSRSIKYKNIMIVNGISIVVRMMPQLGAPLTDYSRSTINDCSMFIIQATNVLFHWLWKS